MTGYNTYYTAKGKSSRAIQPMTAVSVFAYHGVIDLLTDSESPWKWLGDYMLATADAQSVILSTEEIWTAALQDFFTCTSVNVDFTTAGQIANWLPLWKEANNYLPRTMRATDEMPVIRKGNDLLAGWYDNSDLEGEPVTSVTEDITLYAKWKEALELDEESDDNIGTIAANDGQTVNVVLRRPFEANGYWYTLVLPFDVSAEQMAETFGEGYQVTVLQDSYLKSSNAMYLNFVHQTHINAGEPCLFKPGRDIEELAVFHNVTIDYSNGEHPEKSTTLVDMVGMYAPTLVDLDNYYLGNTNYLHQYVEAYQNTKGFRAYFHFNQSLPAGCSARVVFHEDTATDIDAVTDNPSPVTQKLIRDGQLIIIRDGMEYNAQGQRIQ